MQKSLRSNSFGFIYINTLFLTITTLLSCQNQADDSRLAGLLFHETRAGAIRTYFTDPRPGVAPETRFAARNRMIDLIDRSNRSIRLWAYGLNEPAVLQALARAAQRGVEVSITGSPDQSYDSLTRIFESTGTPLRLAIRRRSGLQHIKLAVFDQKIVFTGTGNFTRSGFLFNHNAFLELPIIAAYRTNWLALFESLTHESDLMDEFIDPATPAGRRSPVFSVAPGVRILLSPAHGRLIQSRFVHSIRNAKQNVRFLIFSFTDPVIAAALYGQARRGVLVQGIFDDPNNSGELDPGTIAARLNHGMDFAPAEFYLEGNRRVYAENSVFHGGHLHHKTLLVDDTQVITGSYNWSMSARDRNLEILLAIDNAEVAAAFRQEFERIRSNAVLLARPPFPTSTPSHSIPRFARGENQICVPAVYAQLPLTVFAGNGPYFRSYQFRALAPAFAGSPGAFANDPQSANSICRQLTEMIGASSGISTGKRYLLPPETTRQTTSENGSDVISDYVSDFVYLGGPTSSGPFSFSTNPGSRAKFNSAFNSQLTQPCARAHDCDPVEMYRANLHEGWLWLKHPGMHSEFQAVRIWNRNGLQPAHNPGDSPSGIAIPLRPQGAGFYRFTPPPEAGSDALLFLEAAATGDGRTGIACVQSGTGLEPALREFLAAFAWDRGFAPACINGE